jgi:soluble lytic murein transglycosylase-like protein
MRRPLLFATWAAGVAAAALVAAASVREPGPGPATVLPPLAPASGTQWLLAASPARDELATALRRADWRAALRRLEPTAGGSEPAGPDARLLLGFAAHAHGRLPEAERWLGAARDGALAVHRLGDWRLFLLSDAAAASGHRPAAIAALEELLRDHPASALHGQAQLKLAELLAADGQSRRAIELVVEARAAGLASEPAVRLEALAWEVGRRLGDRAVQIDAARRLLVIAPLEASRLQVTQVFAGGDWAAALRPDELERRAESLLALELAPSADQSLDAVPVAARGPRWSTLKARALVAMHRAAEACELLAGVAPTDPAERLLIAWTRAQAAGAAATAVPGRNNPPSAVRARYRQLEEELLQRAAAHAAADPAIGRLALRALYADFEAEERTEEAVATLARLRALDPADTTGARHLWERGWREYRGRNFTGAVGWWTQLHGLYPKTAHGRSARYWTARAFAALGETRRAQELFGEVAAVRPVDFYARQAALRLATRGGATGDEEATATEPWPEDPLLDRATLLTDLGLDALALAEIELLAGRPEGRSEAALRGVVLARQGDRRESLRLLRRAFSKLGTAFQAEVPRAAVELFYPLDYGDTIRRMASAQRLPAPLVFAVIHQESAFDAKAKSRSGARGLMQVMPATGREVARQLGMPFSPARLYEPETSVRLGTTYLRQMLSLFDGNVELALAGYNGGPNRIRQLWHRAGPAAELDSFLEDLSVEESKNYVKRILVLADGYRQLYPDLG